MQELISLSDLNPILIKELIKDLKEKYKENDSALEIIEKSNSWKMDVKRVHHGMINKFATGKSEFSKSEKQTLAIETEVFTSDFMSKAPSSLEK